MNITSILPKDAKKIADHMSLPITIFEHPDLNEQIDILDPYFNTKEIFNDCADFLRNRPNLMGLVMSMSERVINSIKESDGFKKFNNADIEGRFPLNNQVAIPKQNIYCQEYKDTTLISFDLNQANYQVMNLVAPEIFKGLTFENYCFLYAEDFITHAYFSRAKKMRQIVFGNLNPSRQASIMKRLMNNFALFIANKYPDLKLVSGSHDELVYSGFQDGMTFDYPDLDFKQSIFTIKEGGVKGKYLYYYKVTKNGKISIKGVPEYLMCEVCCHLSNRVVPQSARTFMHDGRKAMFVDSLF